MLIFLDHSQRSLTATAGIDSKRFEEITTNFQEKLFEYAQKNNGRISPSVLLEKVVESCDTIEEVAVMCATVHLQAEKSLNGRDED